MTGPGPRRPFARGVLVIPPGGRRVATPDEAFVFVKSGEVELVCRGGARARFGAGDMVWLSAVGPRALLNRGHEAAVLVATWRSDDSPAPRSS